MESRYKYIDLSYLQKFSNGNQTFIKEIILISVEQTKNEIAALREALQTNNYEKIRSVCHKIRSSMGYMGVSADILNKLKEIETAPVENKDTIKINTEQIIEACIFINNELLNVLQYSAKQ